MVSKGRMHTRCALEDPSVWHEHMGGPVHKTLAFQHESKSEGVFERVSYRYRFCWWQAGRVA